MHPSGDRKVGHRRSAARWRGSAAGGLRCVANISDRPYDLGVDARVLLSSGPLPDHRLPVDTVAWLA